MRATSRMRTLAAVCALLMIFATVPANAWVEKPIESPQGPPTLNPTEIGDPDPGHDMPIFVGHYLFFLRLPAFLRHWQVPFRMKAPPTWNPRLRR